MLASKDINASSIQPASKKDQSAVKAGHSVAAAPLIQTKLKIGSPGDSFEREADSMADQVVSSLNSKNTDPRPSAKARVTAIQKTASEEEQVMTKTSAHISNTAPQQLYARLSAYRAQGTPLESGIRSKMESSFEADFSNVRVHAGPSATQMNQNIGARAFTYGADIYFNQSEYNPKSKSGQRLLAHELTHTLQQGGANSLESKQRAQTGIQRKTNSRVSQMIQMESQSTAYGDFETVKYNDLKTLPPVADKVGVQMHLKFTPNSKVDARKIGMVQIAKGNRNGLPVNSGIYGRRSATHGNGQGHFIDRGKGYTNPVYASESRPRLFGKAENLKDYAVSSITTLSESEKREKEQRDGVTGADHYGFGKIGYRYNKKRRVAGPVAAELYDAPFMKDSGNNSEQIFETTALALEGNQKDKYYGSVEWGWRRDHTGNFTRLPLKVVSEGTPSNNFMTAATIWNGASEDIDIGTSQKIIDAKVLKVKGNRAVPAPGVTVDVPADTPLNIKGVLTSNGAYDYVAKVKIDGKTRMVLIPRSQTKPLDIGRPTVNLPIEDVFTVVGIAGVTLNQGIAGATQTHLAQNTRIRKSGSTNAAFEAGNSGSNMIEVEVIQGPHTGKTGYLHLAHLTKEVRGTR